MLLRALLIMFSLCCALCAVRKVSVRQVAHLPPLGPAAARDLLGGIIDGSTAYSAASVATVGGEQAAATTIISSLGHGGLCHHACGTSHDESCQLYATTGQLRRAQRATRDRMRMGDAETTST